jgi:hypothetical protein
VTVFVGAVTVMVFVTVSVYTTVRVFTRVCCTVLVRTWVTVRTSVIVFVPPHEASAAATAAATGTRKGGLGFTAMTLDDPSTILSVLSYSGQSHRAGFMRRD